MEVAEVQTAEEVQAEVADLEDIYSLPEYEDPKRDLSLYVDGSPLETSIDGLFIRQPYPEDIIQADAHEKAVIARYRIENEEIQALMLYPAPEEEITVLKKEAEKREKAIARETDTTRKNMLNRRVEAMYAFIEGRTAASQHVEAYGAQKKNLWFLKRLLVDAEGGFVDFDSLTPNQQNQLYEEIDDILDDIALIPFALPE